jgi:hypothetical protein
MHGRHLAPLLGDSVEAATRVQSSLSVITTDDVDVIAYNCSAVVTSWTEWIDLLYL